MTPVSQLYGELHRLFLFSGLSARADLSEIRVFTAIEPGTP